MSIFDWAYRADRMRLIAQWDAAEARELNRRAVRAAEETAKALAENQAADLVLSADQGSRR